MSAAMGKASRQKRTASTTDASATGTAGLAALPVMAFDRRQTLLICSGLAILVCLVFGSVLSHPFIGLDDPDYISRNPLVQKGLTAEGIRWAFTALRPFYWHPLTWLSLMLDCSLFGLKPGLHLLVNVFIHLLSTLILFRILQKTTGATWRSALVAALWAVHPLRVESVAWIAERKDVLSTFFFLVTVFAHVHYTQRPNVRRYLLVFGAFALAVMSKPMAVSIPVALLVFDFWPLRRLTMHDRAWVRPLLEKVPMAIVAVAVVGLTFPGQARALSSLPLGVRLANVITSYAAYLGKMIVPHDLSILYPFDPNIPAASVIGSLLLLMAITAAVLHFGKRRPYLPAGWFWYLLTLVPVIGFVQSGTQGMADRFVYVPGIGLTFALVWLAGDALSTESSRRTAAAMGVALVLALSALSIHQLTYWRNTETLFRHAIEITPNNGMARVILGEAFIEDGKIDEALAQFDAAARAGRGAPLPLSEMGRALILQKRFAEAIEPLRRAIAADPTMSAAHENLGSAYLGSGATREALAELEEALRLDDGSRKADIIQARGNAKVKLGRIDEGIADIQSALSSRPTAAAWNDLASAYASRDDFARAQPAFLQSIKLDPKVADTRLNYAALLSRAGRNDEALQQIREAMRIAPASPEPAIYLALTLAQTGRRSDAANAAEQAMRLDPAAANDYLTKAVRMPASSDNLTNFIGAMRAPK